MAITERSEVIAIGAQVLEWPASYGNEASELL
jgi:hypothetical protein